MISCPHRLSSIDLKINGELIHSELLYKQQMGCTSVGCASTKGNEVADIWPPPIYHIKLRRNIFKFFRWLLGATSSKWR